MEHFLANILLGAFNKMSYATAYLIEIEISLFIIAFVWTFLCAKITDFLVERVE